MKWRHMESKERREQEKQAVAAAAAATAAGGTSSTSISSTSSNPLPGPSNPTPGVIPRFPPFLHTPIPQPGHPNLFYHEEDESDLNEEEEEEEDPEEEGPMGTLGSTHRVILEGPEGSVMNADSTGDPEIKVD